jgi:predicted ATPase
MAHDVFICHSSQDKAVADAACAALERADIACWIAPRNPVPGVPYGRQIIDAIERARALLLLFSAHANRSEHVARELEIAANAEKPIVPLRIEAVMPSGDLQYYVMRVHWLDATAPPLETRLSELVAAVQQVLEATPRHNLPPQLTPLIGRDEAIVEIAALLERSRLVTLTGSGGIGKTRASLQVAANLLRRFSDGVWLVELAPLTRGEYIPSTVAQALALRIGTDGDPVEHLVRALKGKQTLLVFDNCEHLIDETRSVAAAIVQGCPNVRILATSRQGLNLTAEEEYRLPALATPSAHQQSTTQTASEYSAVRLFIDRALSATKHFAPTDDNAPDVAEICRRLDGIPLAIELAAARVKILSPKQLAQKLDERFRVLTGGSRDVLPRQQTLRALIDWSYDLLDERERTLFRRLGIFANGFVLEGAVAVGSDEELDELDVIDVLASLVDKSLVLAEPQGDAVRYRLLESTRAYALEKLIAAGEREPLGGRHLLYLRDRFAQSWQQYERTGRTADLGAALQIELEDVRFALDGASTRAELIDGGELLANIGGSWQTIGLDGEGMARCEAYLAALPDQLELRARLLNALASYFIQSGQKARAFEVATQAVECARASADASLLAAALPWYAYAAAYLQHFDDAEQALAQAEAIPQTSAVLRIRLLEARASLSSQRGDLETAARMREQLRNEFRSLGNTRGEQVTAVNLAEIEHARGQTQRAIAIVR